MKRNLLVTGSCLMLMAAGLTGCNDMGGDDKPATGGAVDVTITASTGGAATRTVYQEYDNDSKTHIIHWHPDDKIGVIAHDADGRDYFGRNTEFGLTGHEGAFGTFSGSLDGTYLVEGEPITYRAYFPYDANNVYGGTLRTNLPAVQRPTAASFDPAADFLVSETLKYTGELGKDNVGNNINFKFRRPVSIVKLSFKMDGVPELARETIEKVVFRVAPLDYGDYVVPDYICGDVYAEFDMEEWQIACSSSHNTATCYDHVTMDYIGKGYTLGDPGFSAWFTMLPNIKTREFYVTIETTNYNIVKTVSSQIGPVHFVENAVNRATIDLATGTTITAK